MVYNCNHCNFSTDSKPNYSKHILTNKHKKNAGICISSREQKLNNEIHKQKNIVKEKTRLLKEKEEELQKSLKEITYLKRVITNYTECMYDSNSDSDEHTTITYIINNHPYPHPVEIEESD